MRQPKPEWVAALKALDGMAEADLRFNEVAHRWEFLIPCVDGQLRSQFYCWTHDPQTGAKLEPDPITGFLPFRELDDAGMRRVLRNLEQTYLLNPYDGPGTAANDVARREAYNKALWKSKHRDAATAFADLFRERERKILYGAVTVTAPKVQRIALT